MTEIIDDAVVIIVQARMSSTRLPGKVMRQILGKPLLGYLIERLRMVKSAAQLVIATSIEPEDDVITDYCQTQGVRVFRGNLFDVLDRYVKAAQKHHAKWVVRICSDCPLFDPKIADLMIHHALKHPVDWTSNILERTFPRGMEIEVCSIGALEQAHREGTKSEEREHVTPYIYHHPELFSLSNYTRKPPLPDYRLCVDTMEDFELIRRIIETLYPKNPQFSVEDIVHLVEHNADWLKLNAHIRQKSM